MPMKAVLIESDWNLKTSQGVLFHTDRWCINRIRLEFKGGRGQAVERTEAY